jgi:hypothetical protein
MALECRIFYHDKCFDGACSASLFMRFHRECVKTANKFSFYGLVHRAGALFDEEAFIADENAIVDFKYSASPKVTWWFDHHQSAFLTAEDQKNFEAGQADGSQRMRKFFNPNYVSCTSLIADIGQMNFGFNTAPLLELIKWADIVDGARYESAKAAVEMAAPAMKLTMVIESASDDKLVPRIIADGDEFAGGAGSGFCAGAGGSADGAALGGARVDSFAGCGGARRDYVRYHGPADGGIQQIYSVLSVSRGDVQRGVEQVEFSDEGFGGDESLDFARGFGVGESGSDLRAVWRWGTCSCGGDQLSSGPGG